MAESDVVSPEDLAARVLEGDRRAAARMITLVEDQDERANEMMKLVFPHTGRSMIIGITGAGGSGKSTLIDHLIGRFRGMDKRVGIVAVDPSSPFSGGAFLGDRVRFQSRSVDEGVYIRSMAARGYLGGLARATTDVVRIMEAMGNEVIIIETLGAGQDEIDVIHVAQTCVLVLTPGMGDDIQVMKAGIMEIADINRLRGMVDEVFMDEKIEHYILDLVQATRDPARFGLDCASLIRYGASPRASIYLAVASRGRAMLSGRGYVVPQDVKDVALDILRHRILLTYEAAAEEVCTEDILRQILDTVEVP